MDIPIVREGKTIGNCVLEPCGLYWQVRARCELLSERVERLYCGARRLGVLEREENALVLRRQVSRASFPELPPKNGVMTLSPTEEAVPWSGAVLGYSLTGFRKGEFLLFPYASDQPCPCEPLFCFFEICNGFWRLPLVPEQKNDGE